MTRDREPAPQTRTNFRYMTGCSAIETAKTSASAFYVVHDMYATCSVHVVDSSGSWEHATGVRARMESWRQPRVYAACNKEVACTSYSASVQRAQVTPYRNKESSIQISSKIVGSPAQTRMMTTAVTHPTMVPILAAPLRTPAPAVTTTVAGLHILHTYLSRKLDQH